MFATNLVKYLSRRASASVGNVIEPLGDAFLRVGTGCNVKQTLIGLGVLHDSRCLPLHREHHRAFVRLRRKEHKWFLATVCDLRSPCLS